MVEELPVGTEHDGLNPVGRKERGSGRMKTPLAGVMFTLMVGMMQTAQTRTDSTKTSLVFISSFGASAEAHRASHLDPVAGTLTPAHRTSGVEHPFFLALSPDRRFLYSIHARQFGGKEHEQVAAYEVVRDRRAEAAEPAVGPRDRGLLPGRRCDGQDGARGQLLDGQRGLAAGAERRLAGQRRVVRPARGLERRSGPAEGAARPLHRRQPRQPVRLRGRPGARPGAVLPAGRGHGEADRPTASRSCERRRAPGRGT